VVEELSILALVVERGIFHARFGVAVLVKQTNGEGRHRRENNVVQT
jgi:hypothetical protein